MNFVIRYHKKVASQDIPKLNGSWKRKVQGILEAKLSTEPSLYGKPLRKDLAGCYKLRVGVYRVIYKIKSKTVYVYAIQHRSVIYKHKHIEKRMKE